MRITCTQSNLNISALRIQFVDGVADVDESLLPALAAYAVHGVQVPGDTAPEGPGSAVAAPTARSSRADWVAYAMSLGIDVPDGATKAVISALALPPPDAPGDTTPEGPGAPSPQIEW